MGPRPHRAQGNPLTLGPDLPAGSTPGVPFVVDASPPTTGPARGTRLRRLIRRTGSPLSPDDTASLVDAARDGDRQAFEVLVRSTYGDTYSLAQRLTGDDDDARDVVQETYLRAFRGIARFRGDAQFTTWLYRITANCASTHLGRRRRHRHDQLDDDLAVRDPHPTHDPSGRAEHALLRERLQHALRTLSPRLRQVIVLREVYDLPHEAIAVELGISESAAKVRLHRARRQLRDDAEVSRIVDDTDAASPGTRRWAS